MVLGWNRSQTQAENSLLRGIKPALHPIERVQNTTRKNHVTTDHLLLVYICHLLKEAKVSTISVALYPLTYRANFFIYEWYEYHSTKSCFLTRIAY